MLNGAQDKTINQGEEMKQVRSGLVSEIKWAEKALQTSDISGDPQNKPRRYLGKELSQQREKHLQK